MVGFEMDALVRDEQGNITFGETTYYELGQFDRVGIHATEFYIKEVTEKVDLSEYGIASEDPIRIQANGDLCGNELDVFGGYGISPSSDIDIEILKGNVKQIGMSVRSIVEDADIRAKKIKDLKDFKDYYGDYTGGGYAFIRLGQQMIKGKIKTLASVRVILCEDIYEKLFNAIQNGKLSEFTLSTRCLNVFITTNYNGTPLKMMDSSEFSDKLYIQNKSEYPQDMQHASTVGIITNVKLISHKVTSSKKIPLQKTEHIETLQTKADVSKAPIHLYLIIAVLSIYSLYEFFS
jgi:hypothetical protein